MSVLHLDLRPGDRFFWYTSTGWMMWNFLVSSMLVGVRPLLYDGNPAYPDPGILWKFAEGSKAKMFGASPTFVQMQEKFGVVPGEQYDLSELESISRVALGKPLGVIRAFGAVGHALVIAPGRHLLPEMLRRE